METTALVPYAHPFDRDAVLQLGAAVCAVRDSFRAAAEAIARLWREHVWPHVLRIMDAVLDPKGDYLDYLLRCVATGKEYHLMLHARRARTRKKYRNRLLRRWWALMEDRAENA